MQRPCDVLAEVRRAQNEVRSIAGGFEEIAARFVRRLEKLEVHLAGLSKGQQTVRDVGTNCPRRPPQRAEHVLQILRNEARAGVTSLEIAACPNGSFVARINGRAAIPLSKQLGALLDVLATPGRPTPDGFVPWRTKDELARSLRKRAGSRTRAAQVPQAIDRLRTRLRIHGENDHLIENNPDRGYRFALRTNPSAKGPVIDDEG